MTRLALFQAVAAADRAWMAEITRIFGDRDAASARFHGTANGEPTSLLRELRDTYVTVLHAYRARPH